MPALSRRLVATALCLLLASSAVCAGSSVPDAVIVFEPGTDSVPEKDNQTLEQIAAKTRSDPGKWINLEAYANDLGSRELNLALAQRRIEDISHRLALFGFPAHRIRGTSYRERPSTEDDLPMRRVEIRIEKMGL